MSDTDVVVQKDVAVPMRDGVVLRADVYLPGRPGRYPVLLQRTPYNKALAGMRGFSAREAAHRGYAVVIQDTRGRFQSEGEFHPFQKDAADGYDTVEWAAAQPWSNGKVAMYGGSYMGGMQYLAASARPPHLLAMAPAITGSSHYDGWVYSSGVFNLSSRLGWTLNMIQDTARRKGVALPDALSGVLQGLGELAALNARPDTPPEQIVAKQDELTKKMQPLFHTLPLTDIPIPQEVGQYFFDWLAHWKNDEYWEEINTRRWYDQIELPMLHIGGWYDLFLKGTLENYMGFSRAAARRGAAHTQKLVIGPWRHGAYTRQVGELDFGPEADESHIQTAEMHLGWFDYWLQGIDHGISEQPPVLIFVMGENRWRAESEWPLSRAVMQPWYIHSGGAANSLEGDGYLSPDPPGAEPPDRYVYDPADPVPSRGGNILPLGMLAGPRDQREVEQRQDVLVYTSPPLEEDLEVTGYIKVRLWASTDAPDTDFTAKLVNVHPDGYAQNVQDGIVRARFRQSLEQPSPVPPHQICQYEIDLNATSMVFKKGHRLRLEISSSNFPRYDRNLNTGGVPGMEREMRVAHQTIYHDAAHPSHILLPIIPRG